MNSNYYTSVIIFGVLMAITWVIAYSLMNNGYEKKPVFKILVGLSVIFCILFSVFFIMWGIGDSSDIGSG